jgi:hypothetical protein
MAFVHEDAADRTGSGVDVLVVAPGGEVGAGVMQSQRQVAGGVRAVEADRRALCLRKPRDFLQVEGLAGAVLDARPQHQGQPRSVLFDGASDGRHRNRPAGLVGLHLDQALGRVEAVEADLRLNGLPVGRKRARFDQDRRPIRRGPVKADHQQMQVDGQRVHRRDFDRLRAHQFGQRRIHRFQVAQPGPLALEVALHRELAPDGELGEHRGLGVLRLQAQRIADEVRQFTLAVARNVEALAEAGQRIIAVRLIGPCGALKCHGGGSVVGP